MQKATIVTTRWSLCPSWTRRVSQVWCSSLCFLLCCLWLFGGLLFAASPAQAAVKAGDILVADQFGGTTCAGHPCGALFVVNPKTGQRTILSDLGNPAQGRLGRLYSLAVGRAGQIFVIRCGASLVPAQAILAIRLDEAIMKKAGRPIHGAAHSRNGAGTARQEYRPLWGLNVVWAIMRIPLQRWPGHFLRLPIGHELSRKAPVATALKVPSHSRSALARRLVAQVAAALPTRPMHVATDGGDATQAFFRALPSNVQVVGRFLRTGVLFHLPPLRSTGQRGAPRKHGARIGSPKTWSMAPSGWHPPPQEAGAFLQSWGGMWDSVLPGQRIRIVVVWRPQRAGSAPSHGKKTFGRLQPLEACFSTDVALSPCTIVETYADRWAMEMALRDGHASYGVAQEQCRTFMSIVGANTFRLRMAAARTLWCIVTSEHHAAIPLQWWRPWYRQKVAPSQADVACACREALYEVGMFPIPRFFTTIAENQQEADTSKLIAA